MAYELMSVLLLNQEYILTHLAEHRGRVVRCRTCDREVVGSKPAQAVYQRQLSERFFRGRLTSTSESWGVNGHTTRCTSRVSVVLRLRLVSG